MSADWEMILRVRVRDMLEHDEQDAESVARKLIEDEGGPLNALTGFCDPADIEIVSLRPADSPDS